MTKPRAQSPIDRMWAKKAEDLQLNSLERIKSVSEKWLGTIASLTGVFGIIALIKGPSDISELSSGFRASVVILLIIAVVSTFLAIILAALAAQGIPKFVWATGSVIKKAYAQEADKALYRLNWSRFLVIPAVITIGLAIGLTWYGTWNTPSKPTKYIAIYSTGEVMCGQLANSQGQLALMDDNNIRVLENIESLNTVDSCP